MSTPRSEDGRDVVPRRHALLVLTRDPGGELSGRKTVLATIANSLEVLGFSVQVIVLSRSAPAARWRGRPVHHVGLPSLPRVAASALAVLVTRRGSLNEALFDAPHVRRAVSAIAEQSLPSVVIADTVRTYRPARASGADVIVHLDDLLSERYRALAQVEGAGEILGFFGEQLPTVLRRPAAALAARMLRLESRLLAAREVELARDAAGAAITSPVEARELERRSGRRVVALPMAVDVRVPAVVASAPAASFAFLGLMTYTPNREAVRWWRDRVRPELDRRGGEDVLLTVIGGCSDDHRRDLEDERIHFVGYVEDLGTELRRHRGFVAPIINGTGVKTKVLDALSVGLPVVTTPAGVSGLPVVNGATALVASDPTLFAEAVLRLRDDAALASRIGGAGRELLASTWSSRALVEGWASLLSVDVPSFGSLNARDHGLR